MHQQKKKKTHQSRHSMCTSSPANTMRKKSVSFFEQVQIREINFDHDDESLDEYEEDLVKDYGDYHDKNLNNVEGRRSMLGKSLDFSGKIYSSSVYDAQTDRYPSKLLLLPSLKADRWQSTSTGKKSRESDEESEEQPENDEGSRERPRRKQEDGPCFKDSSMPAVPIRVSSNEELTSKAMCHNKRSSGLPPLPNPNGLPPLPLSYRGSSPSLRRKITSAPSLARLKRKSKKSHLSVSESRNATFGNNSTMYKNKNKNNKPPCLPTRWNSLLDRVNSKNSNNSKDNEINRHSMESCSSNTSATTLDSNISIDNLGLVQTPSLDSDKDFNSEDFALSTIAIPESPRSSNRRSLLQRGFGSLRSLTGATNSSNPNHDKSFSSLPDREYRSEEFSLSPMKASMESIPESPNMGNRRNLLKRGIGSLRSLTKPMARICRNDLPPVRPIRTRSVRILDLDDTL